MTRRHCLCMDGFDCRNLGCLGPLATDGIDDLIEASSLGTPAAKAFRESVSDEDVDRIMDRFNELDDATFRRPAKKESHGDGPVKPHAARAKYRRRKHHRKS